MSLFVQRIKDAGFSTYRQYLNSPHWEYIREVYRISGRPRECFVCGDTRYQLHHLSYVRIGREKLDDVLPLCGTHHYSIHKDADSKAPYQIFLLTRFFFPLMGRRDRKKMIAQFTSRNIGKKWRRFKRSGALVEGSGETQAFVADLKKNGPILKSVDRRFKIHRQRRIQADYDQAAVENIKNLIRRMNEEKQ